MFKLDLEKAPEVPLAKVPEIKLPTSIGNEKAREFQKSIYLCFIDYAKAFDHVDHNWKILKEMEIPDHLICLRNLYVDLEITVRILHRTTTGSKLGKEYNKVVYCHLAYLTYMQGTSYDMLGWMSHKLESRFPGEISATSDMQMIPLQWQKVKRN